VNNQTSITKKLVSVFLLNGKVLVKNLPDNPWNVENLKHKYPGNDKLLFFHTLPLDDRKFPIYEPIKNKKK
jgi:hypothetical protein